MTEAGAKGAAGPGRLGAKCRPLHPGWNRVPRSLVAEEHVAPARRQQHGLQHCGCAACACTRWCRSRWQLSTAAADHHHRHHHRRRYSGTSSSNSSSSSRTRRADAAAADRHDSHSSSSNSSTNRADTAAMHVAAAADADAVATAMKGGEDGLSPVPGSRLHSNK